MCIWTLAVTSLVCLPAQMTYRHSEKGGTLNIDGRSPFRQYHIGPCSNLTSVEFGGIGPLSAVTLLRVRQSYVRYLYYTKKLSYIAESEPIVPRCIG